MSADPWGSTPHHENALPIRAGQAARCYRVSWRTRIRLWLFSQGNPKGPSGAKIRRGPFLWVYVFADPSPA